MMPTMLGKLNDYKNECVVCNECDLCITVTYQVSLTLFKLSFKTTTDKGNFGTEVFKVYTNFSKNNRMKRNSEGKDILKT